VLRSRPLEEKIALAREFSNAVIPLISSGRIKPVVDSVFRFDQVAKAQARMEANESFGKIVLTW
jgi:NADPH:quinone reductase-like Zn-dependent oxidoreductase